MKLVIVGSIAIDDITTPKGRREFSVGGSAVFASIAASKITSCGIVGVVGEDFPEATSTQLQGANIDLQGLEHAKGKTFRWKGVYNDLNKAETQDTQLNVFADFSPKIPTEYINPNVLFLGNIHPQLQLDVIAQAGKPKLIALDTMNYWIKNTPDLLTEAIKKIDILIVNEEEIRLISGKQDVFTAADSVLELGPKYIIIKRGEYGSIVYGKNLLFFMPVYPVRDVFDPTGAGDSFAGGFLGYLSNFDIIDETAVKTAMLYGTATASINIESFSYDALLAADKPTLKARVDFLKKCMEV